MAALSAAINDISFGVERAMHYRFVFFLVVGLVTAFSTAHSAAASACKPPGSPGMLTGPVYDSMQAECDWIDAIDHRDARAAGEIVRNEVSQIDSDGTVRNRTALLAAVANGPFGSVTIQDMSAPFSAGSTNVIVSTWIFHSRRHRVMDVYFCDTLHACRYRLIAEQITAIAP